MTRSSKPPKRTGGDTAHTVVKAALSAVPVVGGPAAEAFAALVLPPLERRREEWMQSVGQGLDELRKQAKVDFGKLRDDEEFLDTVLQATQAALRTHQDEKVTALRNAVLNTARGQTPGDSLRQMFVRCVDEFTEWHLRILKLFRDPAGWYVTSGRNPPNLYSGGLSSILEDAYPELRGRRAFYDLVWQDLFQRGLVNTGGLHTMMTGTGLMAARTTDFGNQFLAFISSVKSERENAV
jgi:hypothetical protein